MFSCFLKRLGAKKHRKYRIFLRLASPKPRYLRCFLLLVAKTMVFTVFCGRHLAKNLRSFQHVARSTFSMPQAQKHCKLQCFGFWHPMKNVRKQPKVSKLELLFQASKNGGAAAHFWSSPQPGSGLTFPNGPESEPPPPTPPRLALLRFAYTYTQPRPSAGFRNILYIKYQIWNMKFEMSNIIYYILYIMYYILYIIHQI